jgi:hypothetical protein
MNSQDALNLVDLPIEVLQLIHRSLRENSSIKLHHVNKDLYENYPTRELTMSLENTREKVCRVPEKTTKLTIKDYARCKDIILNEGLLYLYISAMNNTRAVENLILPSSLIKYQNFVEFSKITRFPINLRYISSVNLFSHLLFDQRLFVSPPNLETLSYRERSEGKDLTLILNNNLQSLRLNNSVKIITDDSLCKTLYNNEEITDKEILTQNLYSLPKNLSELMLSLNRHDQQLFDMFLKYINSDNLSIASYVISRYAKNIFINKTIKLPKNIETFVINIFGDNVKMGEIKCNDKIKHLIYTEGFVDGYIPDSLEQLVISEVKNISKISDNIKRLYIKNISNFDPFIIGKNLHYLSISKINRSLIFNESEKLRILKADYLEIDLDTPKSLRYLSIWESSSNVILNQGLQFLSIHDIDDLDLPETIRILDGSCDKVHNKDSIYLPRDLVVITKLPDYVLLKRSVGEGWISIQNRRIYYDKLKTIVKYVDEEIKKGKKKIKYQDIVELDLE